MKIVRSVVFFVLVFGSFRAAGQTLPDSLDANVRETLDAQIEDATQSSEAASATDWSAATEGWRRMLRRPLDLNRATRAQLAQVPGLGPLLADAIVRYREQFGAFVEVWELQSVAGTSPARLGRILPFVTVQPVAISQAWTGQLVTRLGRSFPTARGYTDSTASRFLGSPWQSFVRLTAEQGTRWRAGILLNKLPGERWQLANQLEAFYLEHRPNAGLVKTIVIGDYSLQAGQGLLFSQGLNFARTADPVIGAKSTLPGLRPYLATNRAAALRGAAVELSRDHLSLIVFASQQFLDATPTSEADSVWADPEGWTNLRRSGQVRTTSDQARARSLSESIGGMRLAYTRPTWQIATTHSGLRYNRPRVLPNEPYLDRAFRGQGTYSASFEADVFVRNLNVFSELAYTGATGAWSGVAGVLAALSERAELAVGLRHLDAGHYAIRGATLAQRPLAVSNEDGVYVGLTLRPVEKVAVNALVDYAYSPLPRRLTAAPSTAIDALLQTNWQPSRRWRLLLRYRYARDERTLPERLSTPVGIVTETNRHALRLEATRSFGRGPRPTLSARARAEFTRYTHLENASGYGVLSFVEGRWASRQWGATLRASSYRSSIAGARVIAQDPELPYAFSTTSPSGSGWQLIAQGHYQPSPEWHIYLRVDYTQRTDGQAIGSGGDQIATGIRANASLQLIYQWGR